MGGPQTLVQSDSPPTTNPVQAGLAALLVPRVKVMAADVWELARRSPGLEADPALVAEVLGLLRALNRMLLGEPGRHLVTIRLRPGIRLHALALLLRQMEAAAENFLARRAPPPGPTLAEDLNDMNRMTGALMRDILDRIVEYKKVEPPPGLRTPMPPPPEPPPGRPPYPLPHVRRTVTRRRDRSRRTARAG